MGGSHRDLSDVVFEGFDLMRDVDFCAGIRIMISEASWDSSPGV
jgi:hypothetical protein